MTNRPTYAPERRPGDALEMSRELIAFHVSLDDARVIAALLRAGAAALEHVPISNLVQINAARRNAELGHEVADALVAEAARVRERNRYQPTKRRRGAIA